MRTRVLFITNTWAYGGTERALEDLVVRLDRAHVEPIILCFGPNFYTEMLNQKHNLDIQIEDKLKADGFISYWKVFRRQRPHVALFVNGNLGLFPWYAYLAARLAGAKRVVGLEQLMADPCPQRDPGRGLFEPVLRVVGWHVRHRAKLRLQGILSDQTICVSKAVRKRLIDEYRFPIEKTLTIRNGADLHHFGISTRKAPELRARLAIGRDEAVVVCVARLEMKKGIHVLLQALQQLVKEFPACKCLILGEGPDRETFLQQASDLGLSEVVLFRGYQTDVRPYLEMSDLFVLPSFKEGLPLSLVEAMAYGLPAVVTDVGGNGEVVAHGHNGLIVKPGSVEQLTDAIKYLVANREERIRMGQNGRKTAREFDVDISTSRLKEVLLN